MRSAHRSETSFASFLVSAIVGSPLVLFLTALVLGVAGLPVGNLGLPGLLMVIFVPPILYVVGLGKLMDRPEREWFWAALIAASVTFGLALAFIMYVTAQLN